MEGFAEGKYFEGGDKSEGIGWVQVQAYGFDGISNGEDMEVSEVWLETNQGASRMKRRTLEWNGGCARDKF